MGMYTARGSIRNWQPANLASYVLSYHARPTFLMTFVILIGSYQSILTYTYVDTLAPVEYQENVSFPYNFWIYR